MEQGKENRNGLSATKRKRLRDMRIGTWNIRSAGNRTGGMIKLVEELKRAKVGVAAVQESGFNKDAQNCKIRGYNIFHSSSSPHRKLGTAFLVAQEYQHLVLDFRKVDERLCVLRLKGRFKNYSLINVHAPHNGAPDAEKDAYYERLGQILDTCPGYDIKIILGDFNAQIGKEEDYRPTIGKYSLHDETNDNGLRTIFFAAERGLVVKSTFFKHKSRHLATWQPPDSNLPANQIDHFLISCGHFSDVINVMTSWRANVDSDHYLVVATLRARISRFHNSRPEAVRRLAIAKLRDPEIAATFERNIGEKLRQARQVSSDELEWQTVRQIITDEAINTIGYQRPTDYKGWFDTECAEITAKKNQARVKMLKHNTRANSQSYRDLRRSEKRLHRRKKREFQDRTLLELERLNSINESRKFYKNINDQRRGFSARLNMCRGTDGTLLTSQQDVLNRYKEHFDTLLNGEAAELGDQDYSFLHDDGRVVEEPTIEEVSQAILQLKNNKASGPDNIAAELLKHGGPELAKALYGIVIKIWRAEQLPAELLEGAIVAIHKKGDKLQCENYRGVCLLNTAYKVLARVLYTRLQPHAETVIGEYQCGFRRNRSTTDQIFNLRLILQRGSEFNVQTHHLFIDFKQAYDRIKRRELFVVMKELGFETKLIRLVKATLDGTKCRVKMQNNMSDTFETREGLRQGDALSCLLFNIALEGVLRRAGIQTQRTLATNMVQILAFADDLDIAGRRISDVIDVFTNLQREAAKLGLIVNIDKTKYMKTDERSVPQQQGPNIIIDGQQYEVVDEFVYLGVLARPDGDTTPEIQRRIMAATRCFHGLRKQLRSKYLTKRTKCQIYKTLIRPVLMYGCESWILKVSDQKHLLAFERKVLRTIFGGKREGENWRRRYNFELHRDFGEPDIVTSVKTQRLRWAGHLARMENERAPAVLFRNIPQGQRARGRPKARWVDGVQEDLRTLGVSNWQSRAQNRTDWNIVLDQAMCKLNCMYS